MASLFPLLRLVSGEMIMVTLSSIAADGVTRLRLEPYPIKSKCSGDALDTSTITSLSQQMVSGSRRGGVRF